MRYIKDQNTVIITQILDPIRMSLHGVNLIEASAGTGKTYTLSVLYIRLLLGINGNATYLRPLSVEEILVITFTEVATENLRVRIRETINHMRLACIQGQSKDPLLKALLKQLSDFKLAALLLLSAEQQMDRAAIFTIHSFCQRTMNRNAIEFGMPFQQTLLKDESILQQQVSADFWRRHCYLLPIDVARIVQKFWEGPEDMLADLLPYLQGESPKILNQSDISESILERHAHIIASIDDLKQQWRTVTVDEIWTLIKNQIVDRRIYNYKNFLFWLKKINQWANQPTIDYQVPKELERFKSSILEKKTITGEFPHHPLFKTLDVFYQKKLSLYELMFLMALTEIRQEIKKEKQRKAELGFDDLLSYFDYALTSINGEILAKSVRIKYPLAMIDEFQDTDSQQYRIFHRIYNHQNSCGLLLIGDPKQAIYSFRGANIFTYMYARSKIDTHYTLDTNWRSSPGIINAINQLFQCHTSPFIFKKIPFLPMIAAKHNSILRLVIQQKPQPAMRIWLQTGVSVGVIKYKQSMAQQCAITIRDWLSAAQKGEAWLEKDRCRIPLQASDITILVRNRNEAILINDALSALMIQSVYLSNHNSVFKTLEARELLLILQAVLTPDQENAIRCALVTSLLGFDAAAINSINHNEKYWEQCIEEFNEYHQYWQKYGVLSVLRKIMLNHCIAENLLAGIYGKRRLTNLLHLGELLQEASVQLENKYALIRWLALQIESPNLQATNQQLRLENDHHVVQIITVHKSKGLEFSIVFLPFAADFRLQKKPLFHDRKLYQAWLDLSEGQESLQLAEEERLSEDLRLFYVAVTRSIYHCSIGIAPLFHNMKKKNSVSDLHLSAPGYLIQKGKAGNSNWLRNQLNELVARSGGDIAICEIFSTQEELLPLVQISTPERQLKPKIWCSQYVPWHIISYTNLQQHCNNSAVTEEQPQLDIEITEKTRQKETLQLTPHTFPRGALSGTVLHKIFETLDFTQPLNFKWLNNQLEQQNINTIWLPMMAHWIEEIISIPLDRRTLSLSCISTDNRYTELQFYLSINSVVEAHDLDRLCKQHDPLSALCPSLNPLQIRGMLKGFIDLIFRWNGRYYILDYKSNWLGKDSDSYTKQTIDQTMIDHRYELQYQLYTLALHRFLRYRLVDYNYHRDFGGVYYLFLRGINTTKPNNSIYYCHPNFTLIDELDKLFTE